MKKIIFKTKQVQTISFTGPCGQCTDLNDDDFMGPSMKASLLARCAWVSPVKARLEEGFIFLPFGLALSECFPLPLSSPVGCLSFSANFSEGEA